MKLLTFVTSRLIALRQTKPIFSKYTSKFQKITQKLTADLERVASVNQSIAAQAHRKSVIYQEINIEAQAETKMANDAIERLKQKQLSI